MASRCSRIFAKSSISTLRSAMPKPASFNAGKSSTEFARPAVTSKSASTPLRRFSLSRTPVELGGVASLLPLHSVVAQSRMTSCLSLSSRNCRALSQELGLSVPR
ncbi:protein NONRESPONDING TO OXYLIPINS 2, mitochondrial isoform X4 [Andrographis paniculata]|uniref:protein NONRESPONDING TO OXYLIPINS 2, mitochondrial isoform X4 n=1 Tax=Andrographis paniculata TaxID=175694 RepID=UPI0021E6E631|nr:protein NONRESPONDING TO OXYLIPINS 2, mitochondrial isoform X4 [Andrographis paniculata]